MPVIIPNMSLSSINCNSLNISSIGSFNQKLKIYGIVSLRTDIIMMSDIRLCNAQGTSSSGEITAAFRLTPYGSYEFFHNSNQNKRGVGVLIKRSASISVLNQWRDGHDNILGLQLDREGKKRGKRREVRSLMARANQWIGQGRGCACSCGHISL